MPARGSHSDVMEIYQAALRSADPHDAVIEHWPADISSGDRVSLIAIGKASVAMALGACERCDPIGGLVICPPDAADSGTARSLPDALAVAPADHPVPTGRNVDAATLARSIAESLDAQDALVVLISGGGSAHLTLPAGELGLADLTMLTERLLVSGERIGRINTVRRHCEILKGGGLARAAHPARIVALVVSDVVGDAIEDIASGPVAPDPTSAADAIRVLNNAGLCGELPTITDHLIRIEHAEIPENPRPGDAIFDRVEHRIIANGERAATAALHHARSLGYRGFMHDRPIMGEASEAGRMLAGLALDARARLTGASVGAALIAWGETTVTLGSDPGRGGRNQELALAAAQEIRGQSGIVLASLGTDGIDGPTDAAGAVVDHRTWDGIGDAGIDPDLALDRHDAHRALDEARALVRIGPTGTNVGDIMIALMDRPDR